MVFKRSRSHLSAVTIDRQDMEVGSTYKYLVVHLDDRLVWTKITDAVYKKDKDHLYFLRSLRPFDVCKTVGVLSVHFTLLCFYVLGK